MDKNSISQVTILVLILIIFIFLFIYPFPTTKSEIGEAYTINEIKTECSTGLGIFATSLDKKYKMICSKYNKIYYLFVFALILSILGLFGTLFKIQKNENKGVSIKNE